MPAARARRNGRASILLTFALLLSVVTVMPGALAVHTDAFELQGHVTTNLADKYDWTDFIEPGPNSDVVAKDVDDFPEGAQEAGFFVAGASPDHYRGGADRTTFTQGSKDTLDISDWVCTRSNNVGNKVDIINAYSVAQRNDDKDLVLYFGVEIREPEGNSNVGMWFLKDPAVGCEAPATGQGATGFSGQHRDGDIFVVSAFTNGGNTANISVYRWMGSGLVQLADEKDVACDTLGGVEDFACAIANASNVATDWHSPNKSNVDSPLAPNTFFEGGINLTQLLELDPNDPAYDPTDECFSQFLANTRSSQSLTATIFDFNLDSFNVCGDLTIIKETQDPEDADVDFDFELTGPRFGSDTEEFQLNAAAPVDGNPAQTTYDDLPAGDYTIEEVDLPDGWDLSDVTCVDGNGAAITTGWQSGDTSVTVDLGQQGSVTCTFTNAQRGSVLFEKVYSVDPLPGEAAEFTFLDEEDGEPVGDPITLYVVEDDAEEDPAPDRYIYCADDLITGDDYWIRETGTPTGFETVADFEVPAEAGTCAERLEELPDTVVPTITNDPGTVTVNVTKLKDGTDTGLAGFEFTLYDGWDLDFDEEPPPAAREVADETDDDGETSFDDLALGRYTICETDQPNDHWTEADPRCQEIEVTLDDVENGHDGVTFENAPLADVDILFHDMTGYTRASVVCYEAGAEEDDPPVGSLPLTDYGAGTIGDGDGELNLEKLALGEYDCRISIYNGAIPDDD